MTEVSLEAEPQEYEVGDVERLLQARPESILAELFGNINSSPRAVRYEYWQVEPLLNRAADILERCLTIKHQADEYWIRAAQIALELESDKLSIDKEQIDTDDRNYQILEYARRANYLSNETARSSYGETRDLAADTRENILRNKIDNGYGAVSGLNGRDASQHAATRNAATIELMDLKQQIVEANSRQGHSTAAYENKYAYDTALVALREKKRRLTDGGPLDYLQKIETLVKYQLAPDILDALERCNTAATGLRVIYGWSASDCDISIPDLATITTSTGVEKLYSWVSSAIRWLLKFNQEEQVYSVVVPFPRGSTSMQLRASEVGNFKYSRLRGISAVARTKELDDSLFEITVTPPESSLYEYKEGNSGKVEQNRASVILGRVASVFIPRPPEVGGATTFYNASPICFGTGSWSIAVRAINDSAKRAEVEEVALEFLLVGCPT